MNLELSTQLKTIRQSIHLERSQDSSSRTQDDMVNPENEHGSKSSAQLLKEKELHIETLQLELAELEIRLAQQENQTVSRTREVEGALLQAKLENIRLTENAESYQMLLQERTMKGEYPL